MSKLQRLGVLAHRSDAPAPGSLVLFVYFLQYFYGLRLMPSEDARFVTIAVGYI